MAITPNSPVVNLGNLYLQGMQLSWVSGTSISVAAGQARDWSNTNDIVLQAPAVINAAINGLNGLDTGALAANTFYNVFAIGSSTMSDPTAADPANPSDYISVYVAGAILSLSTTPVLPFGFDMFRYIGSVLTSSGSAILDFSQRGDGLSRDMFYAAAIATNITAGAATSMAPVTASASVPPTAVKVYVKAILTADSGATRTAGFRATSSSSAAGQAFMSSPASTVTTASVLVPCDASGAMDYVVSNSAAAIAIDVSGYVDAL